MTSVAPMSRIARLVAFAAIVRSSAAPRPSALDALRSFAPTLEPELSCSCQRRATSDYARGK